MNPPIIVPTSLLGCGPQTKVHLCYASVALVDEPYRSYYKNRSLKGEAVILDQSPVIPRSGLSWQTMRPVLEYIKPRAIVLPDWDYGKYKTIRLGLRFLDYLEEGHYQVKSIGTVQGVTLEDLWDCYSSMVGRVDVIGLPCGLEKIQSRNSLIVDFEIKKPVVFIETYDNFIKEKPTHPNVDLYWSSFPYRLGLVGKDLSYTNRPPPELCWNETELNPKILKNLEDYVQEAIPA